MRLQRDSYAPKSCAFDAANVQFLRAHLCKSHPVLQQDQLFLIFFKTSFLTTSKLSSACNNVYLFHVLTPLIFCQLSDEIASERFRCIPLIHRRLRPQALPAKNCPKQKLPTLSETTESTLSEWTIILISVYP